MAERMFPRIQKAYSVLSDPAKRSVYDTHGVAGLSTNSAVAPYFETRAEIRAELAAREREVKRLKALEMADPEVSGTELSRAQGLRPATALGLTLFLFTCLFSGCLRPRVLQGRMEVALDARTIFDPVDVADYEEDGLSAPEAGVEITRMSLSQAVQVLVACARLILLLPPRLLCGIILAFLSVPGVRRCQFP